MNEEKYFSNLSPREFLQRLESLYAKVYGHAIDRVALNKSMQIEFQMDFRNDSRSFQLLGLADKTIAEFQLGKDDLLDIFFDRAKSLGLESQTCGYNVHEDEIFRNWRESILASPPLYLREIESYDIPGNARNFDLVDLPAKAACVILKRRGYNPYWSSANAEDASERRKGQIAANINAAYVLVDSANLTPELKSRLRLAGKCDFWGVARAHEDDGYHGIFAEITSPSMRVAALSTALAAKAFRLPVLTQSRALDR